jgi:predicted MFS family arabinose efflux permease
MLSLGAGVLSLSRFGYGLLLPGMRTDLGWSYIQAGVMNTALGLGYLAGTVAAVAVLPRAGERRAYRVAFTVVTLTLLASGVTSEYPMLLALRAIGGAAGAVLFVAGAAFAAHLARASRAPGLVLGAYFAGVGPGIVVSALLAPLVLSHPRGWQLGWLIMGAVALTYLPAVVRATRDLRAVAEPSVVATGFSACRHARTLRWVLAAFALFGLGYVPYMSFIVAAYRGTGAGPLAITIFWAVLGLAATGSGWLWQPLIERTHAGAPVALLLAITALGAVLPVLAPNAVGMLASAVVFGATFLAVITAVTQLIRAVLPEPAWTLGITLATVLFGCGQAASPALTGLLADATATLDSALITAAATLAAGAALASRQRGVGDTLPHRPSDHPPAGACYGKVTQVAGRAFNPVAPAGHNSSGRTRAGSRRCGLPRQ